MYFRGSIGTSFTLPTAGQLYTHNPDPLYPEYGNPNLDPMESFFVNAGIGVNYDFISAEASYFFESVTNQFDLDSTSTWQNIDDETKVNGYTLTANVNLVPTLTLSGSYTRQWSKTEGTDDYRPLPKEFASFGLRWADKVLGADAGLGFFARYQGESHTSFAGNPYFDGSGAPETIEDFWVADFSAYVKINESNQINLYVNNIFDKKIPTAFGAGFGPDGMIFYPYLGNPFTATLSYAFKF
jgi:outer membrane receptor protein involved in Fe transport